MDLYEIFHYILSYYSVVVAGIGSFGNILCMMVCLQERLRKTPTFVFMVFMLAMDTICLYFWNFIDYFTMFYGKTQMDFSVDYCKLHLFTQMWSLQSSAYLLVFISIERLLSVKIRAWRVKYFKSKHSVYLSIAILVFFFGLNSHVIFTVNFENTNNTAIFGSCVLSDTYKMWRPVHTYIYSIVPFVILLIFNLILMHEIIVSKRKSQSTSKSQTHVTFSVMVLTFSFIIFTGPFAIIGGYFTSRLIFTEEGRLIQVSAIVLAFTFHGSNFLILITTNSKFSNEFKFIMKKVFCLKYFGSSIHNPQTGHTNNVHGHEMK